MTINYNPSDEPIVLSKMLLDRLLQDDNPASLISFYTFYYYTAKWQQTNQPKATTSYVARGMKCSLAKAKSVKRRLKNLGLIESTTERDENTNRITGHFVKVNFLWGNDACQMRATPIKKPRGSISHRVGNRPINSFSTKSIKKEYILSSEKNSSDLARQYGRDKVWFVLWFLREQQQHYPKRIKGTIDAQHERVLLSLDVLDRLCRVDGFDFATEVRPILSQVPSDEFWSANLLSLASLRKEGKNGEIKFVNICSTLRSRKNPAKKVDSSQITETPEEIIMRIFSPNGSANGPKLIAERFTKECFQPTCGIISKSTPRTLVAETLCDLSIWLKQQQRRPMLDELDPSKADEALLYNHWVSIPSDIRIVRDYIAWLREQAWIDAIELRHFDPGSALFQKFLTIKQREAGVDFLTGKKICESS